MEGKFLLTGLLLVIIVGVYVGYTMTVVESVVTVVEPVIEPITEPENEINDTEPEPVTEVPEPVENDTEENVTEPEPGEIEPLIVFFWGKGCPHCAEEEVFLSNMKKEYPDLVLEDYEVNEDGENLDMFLDFCNEKEIDCDNVPVTLVGETVFKNFKNYDGELMPYQDRNSYVGYRNQIENTIRTMLGLEVLEEEIEPKIVLSASTDKKIYYEKEPIDINVTIESNIKLTHCYLKLNGLNGHISESRLVHLVPSEIEEFIREWAPSCFGCANFKPGDYDITVWIEQDGKMLDKITLNVEIREAE